MVRKVQEDHFINYLTLLDFTYVTCKKTNKMVAPQCRLGHSKIEDCESGRKKLMYSQSSIDFHTVLLVQGSEEVLIVWFSK